MHDNETIALLRDLFIIVASGLFIVIFLGTGIGAFVLFRRVSRILKNVEHITGDVKQISGTAAETASKLSGVIATGLEILLTRLLGLLNRKSEGKDKNGNK